MAKREYNKRWEKTSPCVCRGADSCRCTEASIRQFLWRYRNILPQAAPARSSLTARDAAAAEVLPDILPRLPTEGEEEITRGWTLSDYVIDTVRGLLQ